MLYWIDGWRSDDRNCYYWKQKIKDDKMQLHNVSIAIRTDIRFGGLSVNVGKMLNKSTKNNWGALQAWNILDIFNQNSCRFIKIIFGNDVAEFIRLCSRLTALILYYYYYYYLTKFWYRYHFFTNSRKSKNLIFELNVYSWFYQKYWMKLQNAHWITWKFYD